MTEEIRNPKHEARNTKHETRNTKQISKKEIQKGDWSVSVIKNLNLVLVSDFEFRASNFFESNEDAWGYWNIELVGARDGGAGVGAGLTRVG
jgi:hypothetical protein